MICVIYFLSQGATSGTITPNNGLGTSGSATPVVPSSGTSSGSSTDYAISALPAAVRANPASKKIIFPKYYRFICVFFFVLTRAIPKQFESSLCTSELRSLLVGFYARWKKRIPRLDISAV